MIRNPICSSRRDFLRISALPEYINRADIGEGASAFLMAMPAHTIKCVLEGMPWPGCV